MAIGLRISLVIGMLSIAGFFVVQQILENRIVAKLEYAAKTRAFEESELFRTVERAHKSSSRMLNSLLAQSPATNIAFDDLFEDSGDNIFRSRDSLYDGAMLKGNFHVDGTAGIIPDANTVTEAEKVLLAAAFQVTVQVGSSYFPELQSYYFFTPKGRLIIRAPNRPDNLLFYRKNSPPDFSITEMELITVTKPGVNPQREFRCTNLQPIAYDPTGRSWTTGCHTPFDINGKHVGAFGSSIRLDKLLAKSVISPIEGGEAMIILANGQLVVHPRLTTQGGDNMQHLDIPNSANADMKAIYNNIQQHSGEKVSVSYIDAIDSYVAIGLVEGLNGYFVISYPRTHIAAEAGDAAVKILAVGLIALLLALFTLARTLRRTVTEPLDLLNIRTKQLALGKFDAKTTADPTQSKGEISRLAASTEKMAGQLSQIVQNLEETIEDRTSDLAKARDEAERASAAKTDFLANMSHEVRTPLTGIIGMLELLEQETLSDSAVTHLSMAQKSSRLLLSLVNDILDISRLEAGKISVHLSNVDIKIAIQDTIDSLALLAKQKNLSMDVIDEIGAPLWLRTDPKIIRQILINLVGNAIKFTDEGSVTIKLNSRAVEQTEWFTLTVIDTGHGLPAKDFETLFNRFEQASAPGNAEINGTGLGLTIVKEFVELLSGTIDCKSKPNQGSIFSVTIPAARGQAENTAPIPVAQSATNSPLDGIRLLAVDDSTVNRIIIGHLCERLGATIKLFENGEKLIEHLQDADNARAYDVLLLDINMPGINGVETLAKIRGLRNQAAELPAIALTADAIDGTEERLRKAGMNGYVSKPIASHLLSAAILEVAGQMEFAE